MRNEEPGCDHAGKFSPFFLTSVPDSSPRRSDGAKKYWRDLVTIKTSESGRVLSSNCSPPDSNGSAGTRGLNPAHTCPSTDHGVTNLSGDPLKAPREERFNGDHSSRNQSYWDYYHLVKSYGSTDVKVDINALTVFFSLFNWKLIWLKTKDLTWVILINYINYIIWMTLIINHIRS